MTKNLFAGMAAAAVCTVLVSMNGCGKSGPADRAGGAAEETGTIIFTANGEDFVRAGFVDKGGWRINFDNLYVNIVDPVAYGAPGEVALPGAHWIDLAAGDESASPIKVGEADGVEPGNYQSLRFKLRRKSEAPFAGASIVMIGTGQKDGTTVPFEIRLDEEMDFDGEEGFVGDEVKGMLAPGGSTTVEMTFHFDHIFGDAEAPADDHINTGSVGFEFFQNFADSGKIDVGQEAMTSAAGYKKLIGAIWTLGHLGEGHCHCTNQSSATLAAGH